MSDLAHGALRGTIAAMAMSGMRELTTDLGLVRRPPPQAIWREVLPGFARAVPRRKRRVMEELSHWTYGAVGGVVYAALPEDVRRRPWSGPAYGLLLWVGFETALAPLLGLKHAQDLRVTDRVALAADHALYGLVLSETRSQPRR